MPIRLDDLQNGYRIYQDPDSFCFGMDAVLLSHFASVRPKDKVLDLCCGNGIVPILLAARYGTDPNGGRAEIAVTGLELQEAAASLARKSVAYNGLDGMIRIVTGDLREAENLFEPASFSVVTCNPPYMKAGSGRTNPDPAKALARHEIACTLADVMREASRVLKSAGHFFMVHRPFRLDEIFREAEREHLPPKALRFVHPYADREPSLVLLDLVKEGGANLRVLPPLIVRGADGTYTGEIFRIYGMDPPEADTTGDFL